MRRAGKSIKNPQGVATVSERKFPNLGKTVCIFPKVGIIKGAMKKFFTKIFQTSVAGSVLTVMSGVLFFFTCMLLPLVGPAGSRAPDAGKNQIAFLSALGVTFLLAVLATWLKMMRRKEDQIPLPVCSMGLCAVCTLLFVLQLTGLLAI